MSFTIRPQKAWMSFVLSPLVSEHNPQEFQSHYLHAKMTARDRAPSTLHDLSEQV